MSNLMKGGRDKNTVGASTASVPPFAPLPSGPTTPFQLSSASFASAAASNGAMSASNYHPNPQPIRPPGPVANAFPVAIAGTSTNGFERDHSAAMSNPFSVMSSGTASPMNAVLLRRLPIEATEQDLEILTVFCEDLTNIELLSPDQSEDPGYRSAVLSFASPDGANEAKSGLDGKLNFARDGNFIAELLNGTGPRRFTADLSSNGTPASSVASSRGSSRFPLSYQSIEGISPPIGSVYNNGANLAGATDLANSEPAHSAYQLQKLFSVQSPIGNHLSDRSRMSGKTLINNEAASDEEEQELLTDALPYTDNKSLSLAMSAAAETGPQQVSHSQLPRPQHQQQRRATAPQIPLHQRLAGLSLNTASVNGSINGAINGAINGSGAVLGGATGGLQTYGHNGGSLSAHPITMSPSAIHGPALPQPGNMYPRFRNHSLPQVNPADQNPPCNTLYVGNLPMNTSEEELKAMFSKQRGYKRLCFRTKSNGPMCFVEFEDVSSATRALTDLYGKPLHNSFKGGVRLSFSKNPLGVRSNQNPNQNGMGGPHSMAAGMGMGQVPPSAGGNGFGMSNGPPPGLPTPPGLPGRMYQSHGTLPLQHGASGPVASSPFASPPSAPPTAYASNGWPQTSHYSISLNGDSPNTNPVATGGASSGYPAYMMGR